MPTASTRAPADRDRLPPGQIITQKWPVLHYGTVPRSISPPGASR